MHHGEEGPDRPRPAEGEPTATLDERSVPAGELRRGASVGRYIVLGRLGAGGMGTVYTAYDPELERRVALKLLHPASGAAAGDGSPRRTAARLLREAQALARLSHPNVLAVYDAGTVEADDGTPRVFLTCELVRGRTLAAWMADGPHPRREVLRLFVQAGRGLAAAHEAGVVHRDFKPGNVMVGDDGRVRVLDFGLARAARRDAADGEGGLVSAAELAGGAAGEASPTRTGAVVGTPAYMAPEQRAGGAVGPEADQYAFCVALWEALTGERPTAADLTAGAADGGRRLPPWLRRALVRGLAADPAERHPSVEALLDALAADPARHTWRWLTAAALLVAAGVGALALYRSALDRAQLCRGGESAIAETWNERRRAALAEAFRAGGSAYADAAFAASATALDRWAGNWAALHRGACEATHLRGEQSTELLDLRVECLESRRRRLDRLLAVAEEPQPPPPDALAEAFADLPSLAPCRDTRGLLAAVPPPADATARRRVEALRSRLDEASALLQVGRYEAGLEVAEPLLEEARGLAYWPLTAEALFVAGRLEEGAGRAEEAAARLDRALDAAVAGGDDRMAAETLVRLVRVHGYELSDHQRAGYFAELAGATLERLSEPAELAAELADHRGRLHFQQGDAEAALAEHRRALALRLESQGEDHPEVASTLLRLANVEADRNELEVAGEHARRAVDLYRRAYGEGHPRLAVGLLSLANVLLRQGDREAALGVCREALAIRRAAFGDDHLRTADARLQVANLLLGLERLAEAEEAYAEVRRVFEAELGGDHPRSAALLSSIASLALARGDTQRARDLFGRALAVQERIYGADHPWVAGTLYNLGVAAKDAGDAAAARRGFARSAAIWRRAYGDDHPLVASALTGLGEALVEDGAPGAAVAPLEEALASRLAAGAGPELLANTRYALARALAASGAPPARALELAEAALAGYREAGEAERAAEVTEWLGHAGGRSP